MQSTRKTKIESHPVPTESSRMISQDDKSNEGTPKNIESPLVFNRDTAPAYWFVDVLWVILVDGEQSRGRQIFAHGAVDAQGSRSTLTCTWIQ